MCTEFLFLALYFLKIALLSANQNDEIFSCILLELVLELIQLRLKKFRQPYYYKVISIGVLAV